MNGQYDGRFAPASTLEVITAPNYFLWARDPRPPHEPGFVVGAARQNSLKALGRSRNVEFLGHFH
jgi:hypothetical protein